MGSVTNNLVLVTGASGMIGRQFCAAIQGSGYGLVRAQVRDKAEAREKAGHAFDFALAETETADFTMMLEQDYMDLAKGCSTVVHSAGIAHRPNAPYQEYEVVNVRATQQVAEAARDAKVHTLVFISSSAVYGPGPFSLVPETETLNAHSPYAVSKATSEKFLSTLEGIPRVIVLRPSLVIGEGDKGNLIKMIREIKNQRYKHIGKGDTAKSVIYVKDLARALLSCLKRVPEGHHVFNVANPEPVTVHDLAEEIATCLNLEKKIASVPAPLVKWGVKAAELFGKSPVSSEQVDKLMTETTCSIDKLSQATGFKPRTSLNKAIQTEIDWATSNSLLD